MSSFDKREEGFEKKFALDEEQKFKAEARRNKLLGMLERGDEQDVEGHTLVLLDGGHGVTQESGRVGAVKDGDELQSKFSDR